MTALVSLGSSLAPRCPRQEKEKTTRAKAVVMVVMEIMVTSRLTIGAALTTLPLRTTSLPSLLLRTPPLHMLPLRMLLLLPMSK